MSNFYAILKNSRLGHDFGGVFSDEAYLKEGLKRAIEDGIERPPSFYRNISVYKVNLNSFILDEWLDRPEFTIDTIYEATDHSKDFEDLEYYLTEYTVKNNSQSLRRKEPTFNELIVVTCIGKRVIDIQLNLRF